MRSVVSGQKIGDDVLLALALAAQDFCDTSGRKPEPENVRGKLTSLHSNLSYAFCRSYWDSYTAPRTREVLLPLPNPT